MANDLELTGEARVERFCELIAEGKTVAEAGQLVGYTNGSARVMATRHKGRIIEIAKDRLALSVPLAIDVVHRLLESEDEKVRLAAAKEVFSRGGVEAVTRQEISVEQRTDDQLREMAEQWLRQHNAKVIDAEPVEDDPA